MHSFWDTSWNKSQRPQIGPFWLCKLHLEWFHTFYILEQDWAALYYYCIISIIVGKWTKPNLENDLLNNSIKSISWFDQYHPNKLYAKNKEKLLDCFEQITEKYQNNQIWHFSDLEKLPLERFNQILLAVQSLGSFMSKYRKGYQTVVEKIVSKWRSQMICPTFQNDL